MKAAYKKNRGKGIEIRDIPIPKILPNEVLVKVQKAAICGTDIHLYEWNDWCENVKAKNPMVIGHEFCGKVVEIGSNVQSINVGDLVAGETHIPCEQCKMCKTGKQHICQNMKILGVHTDGAFAEYIAIPEVCAWKLSNNTTPEIGAIYEPFAISVHGVLKDKITGLSSVIIGAGPIGMFAVGVANLAGSSQIFVVDINDYRLNLATQMGQNVISINSSKEDAVSLIKEKTGGIGADVVIELSGSIKGTRTGFEVLGKNGRVCLIGLHSTEVSLDLVNNVIYKEGTVYGITGREMFDSWYLADNLIKSGKIDVKKVITHEFPLEKIEQAILTAKEGNCGKVITSIS